MADPKKENGIRWTGSRKTELVMVLLKGTDVTELCRKNGISQTELFKWRDSFTQAGKESLKLRRGRKDDKEKEISRLERKIGHLTVQMEILEEVARLKKTKQLP